MPCGLVSRVAGGYAGGRSKPQGRENLLSFDQVAILILLVCLFGLLAWGRFRYDIVAFAVLLAAIVAGLVPGEAAFLGFGHPATITVAFILILSRGLSVSGATDIIAKLIAPTTGAPSLHIASLAGVGAVLSAFMNNVGTLGLLMPVAIATGKRAKRAAAMLLMPLSFGCILGGLITLVGTPPNIIIAAYRGEVTGTPFSMFDFTPVGIVVAAAGVAFVALVGWRLVPARRTTEGEPDFFEVDNYLTEARVPADSGAVGKNAREIEALSTDIDAQIVGLIRAERHLHAPRWMETVRADDILMIEASPDNLNQFVAALGLELIDSQGGRKILDEIEDSQLVETVVVPHSDLEGRTVAALGFARLQRINLLAVSRQGRPYRGRLRAFRFRAGDLLLLHGDVEVIAQFVSNHGCLPLRERDLSFGAPTRPLAAVGLFAGAIALAAFGVLSVTVSLGIAAAAMVITRILPVRELYDSVDWPVVVLLGALIPVGGALETTGTSTLIAGWVLTLTSGFPPEFVVVALLVLTMTVSDILNNAATAVVMAPIAYTIALQLGVNPDPFLMAVAIGASCAFLTPIGHQNNALIMGPGGYRFGDYWRMGLPLEALIVIVAVPMILIVWPL